jgi:transcriptional regulator with XRE-family HTH domain
MGRKINKKLLSSIAIRIRKLREEKGITQEVFYNDTGIHIGRIESTNRDFSMSTFESICSYLEVSMEDFFKGVKYSRTKAGKSK